MSVSAQWHALSVVKRGNGLLSLCGCSHPRHAPARGVAQTYDTVRDQRFHARHSAAQHESWRAALRDRHSSGSWPLRQTEMPVQAGTYHHPGHQQWNTSSQQYPQNLAQTPVQAPQQFQQGHAQTPVQAPQQFQQGHAQTPVQAAQQFQQGHAQIPGQAAQQFGQGHAQIPVQAAQQFGQGHAHIPGQAAQQFGQGHAPAPGQAIVQPDQSAADPAADTANAFPGAILSWRRMAVALKKQMLVDKDPLLALLEQASSSPREAYLDVLALSLEERLTQRQAALVCFEACAVATEVDCTSSLIVPLVFLGYIEVNSAGLVDMLGMMLQALDAVAASHRERGIDVQRVYVEFDKAMTRILNQVPANVHQLPTHQLVALASVAKSHPDLLTSITVCLMPALESTHPTLVARMLSILSHRRQPSQNAAGLQGAEGAASASPKPADLYLERAVRYLQTKASSLGVEELDTLVDLARTGGSAVNTALVGEALLSVLSSRKEGFDFSRTLAAADVLVKLGDESIPRAPLLDVLAKSFTPSALSDVSSDTVCHGVRLLLALSHARLSTVDCLREEVERRVSWLSSSNVRDFLVFFIAARVEDHFMYKSLLHQYERMAALGPLDIPVLLSILEAMASHSVSSIEGNEFFSWFLNDSLAAALQPLTPLSDAAYLTELLKGVRHLAELTSLTPSVVSNAFDLVVAFPRLSEVADHTTIATPIWALSRSLQQESLMTCLAGVLNKYVQRLVEEAEMIRPDALLACLEALHVHDVALDELFQLTVARLNKDGVLQSCSAASLVSIAKLFYAPFSPPATLPQENTVNPAVFLECVSAVQLSPSQFASLSQTTSSVPGCVPLLMSLVPALHSYQNMSLADLIADIEQSDSAARSQAYGLRLLPCLYRRRSEVSTENFVPYANVLMGKLSNTPGVGECVRYLAEDLIARSPVQSVFAMVLGSMGAIRRLHDAGAPLSVLLEALQMEAVFQLSFSGQAVDLRLVDMLHEVDVLRSEILLFQYYDLLQSQPLVLRSINLLDSPVLVKIACSVMAARKGVAAELPEFLVPSLKLSMQLYSRDTSFLTQLMTVMTDFNFFPRLLLDGVHAALVEVFSHRHVKGVPSPDRIAHFILTSKVQKQEVVFPFLNYLCNERGRFFIRSSSGPVFQLLGELMVPRALTLLNEVATDLGVTQPALPAAAYLSLVHGLACLSGNLMQVTNLFSLVSAGDSMEDARRMMDLGNAITLSTVFSWQPDVTVWRRKFCKMLTPKCQEELATRKSLRSVIPESLIPSDHCLSHVVDYNRAWWFDVIMALDENGQMLPFTRHERVKSLPLDAAQIIWPERAAYNVAMIVVPDHEWWSHGEPFGSVKLRRTQMMSMGWMVQLVRESFLKLDEQELFAKCQQTLKFFQQSTLSSEESNTTETHENASAASFPSTAAALEDTAAHTESPGEPVGSAFAEDSDRQKSADDANTSPDTSRTLV